MRTGMRKSPSIDEIVEAMGIGFIFKK